MHLPFHAPRPMPGMPTRLLLFTILGSFATLAGAIDITGYLQLKAGNQWSYQNGSAVTSTVSVGSPVTLASGISAIPITSTRSDEAGYSMLYTTLDASGYRRHQEYISSLFIDGYGYTSATASYAPAMVLAPADVTLGATYTSAGTATFDYAGIGSVTLSYSAVTQMAGIETISNYDGSQSWPAAKASLTVTVSGTANGQFITQTVTSTVWMVDGLGQLMMATQDELGAMETWKLTSTNVVPPTTTTTTSSAAQTTTTAVASTTTTTTAGPGAAFDFVPGWNLVGNSSTGALDVATAFGDAARVATVWKWIAGAAKWAFYAPSLVGQAWSDYAAGKGYDLLTTILGGEGFWVNAKTAFTAPVPSGIAIGSTAFQGMPAGWSLIAAGDGKTPAQFNQLLSTTPPAPGIIPLNLITLWAWDATQANWYFYAPSLESNGGLLNYIQAKNYLDFGSKVLTPTTGFWVNVPSAGATATTTTVAATTTTSFAATTTTTVASTTTTTAPSAAAACNVVVYPASDTGGCHIRLVQPSSCQAITLPFSFEWTTDGSYCETPYTLYITGDPPLQRYFSWQLSENVSQGVTHYGGIAWITAADLANAGVTSASGVYHWDVVGYYGSRPDSRPFVVK